MSTIVDTFNTGDNGQITITGDGLNYPLDKSGESEPIDLSAPKTITIQGKTTVPPWPKPIQVTATTEEPEVTIEISVQLPNVVSGPVYTSYPPKRIWTWTVTPGTGVTSFQVTITAKDKSNSWTDPNATVTIGEPPTR